MSTNPPIPEIPPSTLTIVLEEIKFEEGVILLGFYRDKESWAIRKPAFERVISKSNLLKGKLTVNINDIGPGVYGIAVLDDANANNHVDMGMLFPKEGFGFSNYYHRSYLLPQFENFDFSFPSQTLIHVKMRYLGLEWGA